MPPPIDDPVFGQLERDGNLGLYGEVEFRRGCFTNVYIAFDPNGDSVEGVLAEAHKAFARFSARLNEYRLLSAAEFDRIRENEGDRWSVEDIANFLHADNLEIFGGGVEVFWADPFVLVSQGALVTEIDSHGAFVEATVV